MARSVAPLVPRHWGTSYGERVLIAHFAIMTFGLVAWIGVWQESALGFSLMAGALALTTLVLCFLSVYRARTNYVTQPLDAVTLYRAGCVPVCSCLLVFIRRANLIVGPPAAALAHVCPQRGRRMVRIALHDAPAPFVISVREV
ncbi:MAG: hypothetical protein RMM31_00870 [Anaerolineae bacterium]|nr:hypothetical protein [Thermoflexales bacterium]MDW8394777.1 hypothetical protein [Anaerolineae bacterium]